MKRAGVFAGGEVRAAWLGTRQNLDFFTISIDGLDRKGESGEGNANVCESGDGDGDGERDDDC